jgi:hypothetical protein
MRLSDGVGVCNTFACCERRRATRRFAASRLRTHQQGGPPPGVTDASTAQNTAARCCKPRLPVIVCSFGAGPRRDRSFSNTPCAITTTEVFLQRKNHNAKNVSRASVRLRPSPLPDPGLRRTCVSHRAHRLIPLQPCGATEHNRIAIRHSYVRGQAEGCPCGTLQTAACADSPRTAPARGERYNARAAAVQQYVAYLRGEHDRVLADVGASSTQSLRLPSRRERFRCATDRGRSEPAAQRQACRAVCGRTTRSKSTATARRSFSGCWTKKAVCAKTSVCTVRGVVIGVLDTGAIQEHPSFSDTNRFIDYGPPPGDLERRLPGRRGVVR